MAVVEGGRLQMIERRIVERERAERDGMAVVEGGRLQMIERRIVERERQLEEMGWQSLGTQQRLRDTEIGGELF